MIFELDTNVILDVLYSSEGFHEASKKTLEDKSEQGFFVICPEVYSELVSAFSEKVEGPREKLDTFLEEKQIALMEHGRDTLGLAGRKWSEYDAPEGIECSRCGENNGFKCGNCGDKVSWRNHLITDFMIGAHAEVRADALITRDQGYFGSYFDIRVIDPSR